VKTRPKGAGEAEIARWRRSALALLASDEVAGRQPGPAAPPAWAPLLGQLVKASRAPRPAPSWWTPAHAFFGSVETRTDPEAYRWDGMKRLGPRDRPLVFFQFTLAGWGCFQVYGRPPQRIPPGSSFFAVVPSRHRYYLPPESPGWTFGWLGIYHPYLVRRLAAQIAATGPLVPTSPDDPLVAIAARLVRGAFEKDFRDRFDVEMTLFELVIAYERLSHTLTDPDGERERLLETLRTRVMADPARPPAVADVAAEHGMTRSHFSHFLKARTGQSPARFMTELRIQEAARLLVQTRTPLKQIATACGFANVNHFGKVFRRFQHLSPATYRRSLS
jgi:AraC-like DNA-binding protein